MTTTPNTSQENSSSGNISLDAEALKKLNASFTSAGIKWIAMFRGIWAEVVEVKNGQVTILATFPKREVDAPDPDLVLRIFLRCKQFDFMDRVEKIFLVMYKDEGVAGGVLPADSSREELALLQKASEKFGSDKVHIGERLYDKETLLAVQEEVSSPAT